MLQSKTFRQYLVLIPAWIGGEYIIAYIVSTFMGTSSRATTALFLVGALYAARFAITLINSILNTLTYYLTKTERVNSVVAALYTNEIPVTEEMTLKDGAIEIFESLIKSEETTERTKLFASRAIGELTGIRASNRMLAFIQTQFMWEAAFARYVSEKNARGSN